MLRRNSVRGDPDSWWRRRCRRQTSMFIEVLSLSESVWNCIILMHTLRYTRYHLLRCMQRRSFDRKLSRSRWCCVLNTNLNWIFRWWIFFGIVNRMDIWLHTLDLKMLQAKGETNTHPMDDKSLKVCGPGEKFSYAIYRTWIWAYS